MKAYMFPGQGSQFLGMGGKELFDKFSHLEQVASDIFGYSVKELCLKDPEKLLDKTKYTQPALFVVNALYYRKLIEQQGTPDFLFGHSLGEFNALEASGAINFEDATKLIAKRAELMGRVQNGAMAAIIGVESKEIEEIIDNSIYKGELFIANYNSYKQTVISGEKNNISNAEYLFKKYRYIPLKVSGPFHSLLMEGAANEFKDYLEKITFNEFEVPVISNYSAEIYTLDNIKKNIYKHMISPVKWKQSVEVLKNKGVDEFIQAGPGNVVSNLVSTIDKELTELNIKQEKSNKEIDYKLQYNTKLNYMISGKNYHIGTKEMVVTSLRKNIISFLATDHKSIEEISKEIKTINALNIKTKTKYGLSISMNSSEERLKKIFEICESNRINYIEINSCVDISKELVEFKLKGISVTEKGPVFQNKIFINSFVPELIKNFVGEPPKNLIEELLSEGKVTKEQSKFGKKNSLASCLVLDNNEASDSNLVRLLIPIIRQEINKLNIKNYDKCYLGVLEGFSTPVEVSNIFLSGADFISTSCLNLCTQESNVAKQYKQNLINTNLTDVIKIPSENYFEYGIESYALKMGTLFHLKAKEFYNNFKGSYVNSKLEEKKQSKDELINEMHNFYNAGLKNATQYSDDNINYLIWCGPDLGAFNEYIKFNEKTLLKNREPDQIASLLLKEVKNKY